MARNSVSLDISQPSAPLSCHFVLPFFFTHSSLFFPVGLHIKAFIMFNDLINLIGTYFLCIILVHTFFNADPVHSLERRYRKTTYYIILYMKSAITSSNSWHAR